MLSRKTMNLNHPHNKENAYSFIQTQILSECLLSFRVLNLQDVTDTVFERYLRHIQVCGYYIFCSQNSAIRF